MRLETTVWELRRNWLLLTGRLTIAADGFSVAWSDRAKFVGYKDVVSIQIHSTAPSRERSSVTTVRVAAESCAYDNLRDALLEVEADDVAAFERAAEKISR